MDRKDDIENACSCFLLRKAARHVTMFYSRALAPTGLTATQYSLLVELDAAGPVTLNAFARIMVMDRSTLGRNVRPLEREGLMALEIGEDRRARNLILTDAGKKRLKEAKPVWRNAEDAFRRIVGRDRSFALLALAATVTDKELDGGLPRHAVADDLVS
jgi:DNA-binding MarR family transcriptional regulator